MGTAAGMMIEENLAIAARRGKTPGLKWGLDSDNQLGSANCCRSWIWVWKTE